MDLRSLLRKEVRVMGGGIVYVGTLIEATEQYILLKTDSGFVTVMTDKVTSVGPKNSDTNKTPLRPSTFVSKSFYEFDPNE